MAVTAATIPMSVEAIVEAVHTALMKAVLLMLVSEEGMPAGILWADIPMLRE